MSLVNFISNLKKIKEKLIETRPAQAVRIGSEVSKDIRKRIQSSGEDSTGGLFEGYTPEYSKRKSKKGLNIDYFDFTDTGTSWNNIGAQLISDGDGKAEVSITSDDPETQKKLSGQLKKRGNILKMNQAERKKLSDLNRNRILNFFKLLR